MAGVTGARRGELCGLRCGDVHWDRRLLVIARSIHHDVDKHQLVVAPTKTGRVRRLSLDARTLELLAAYRQQAAETVDDAGQVEPRRLHGVLTYGGINSMAESFFASLQTELLDRRRWTSRR